jgi:hypothetical protein
MKSLSFEALTGKIDAVEYLFRIARSNRNKNIELLATLTMKDKRVVTGVVQGVICDLIRVGSHIPFRKAEIDDGHIVILHTAVA